MKKILFFLLCLVTIVAQAQPFNRNFRQTPMSQALTEVAQRSKSYHVNFIFNELEDFTVTQRVTAKNTPEAILQIIGYYPIRMTTDSTNIFVECVQKSEQKLIGRLQDKQGQPLEFANITLLSLADSTVITGGVSNANGDFVIPCNARSVLMRITYVGFRTIERPTTVGRVGTITMLEDSRTLRDVNIKAARVVTLPDRQLLIPSKKVVAHSANGFDLLQHLQIDNIKVDVVQRTISSYGGGGVQVRINDVKATMADIISLQPDEVVRVENIQNPGIRYGSDNLANVLNFIVRRRYSGDVEGVSTMQALAEGFNNSDAYMKYNYKLSEFSLSYNFSYRNYDGRRLNGLEEYDFPDGSQHIRESTGMYSPFMYNYHNLQLGYNLSKPENYVLNARLILNNYVSPRRGNNRHIAELNQEDIYQYNKQSTHELKPSFDIYYSKTLPNAQKLGVNLVGTYINTDYHYFMQQYRWAGSSEASMLADLLNDYSYATDGNKYSLIGEAIYTRQLKGVGLTAGAYYDLGYTNNRYTGATHVDAVLHTSNLYTYAQAEGRLGKMNYQLGVGIKNAQAHQGDLGYSRWTVRPKLLLSTNAIKNLTLRYVFNLNPHSPGLSDLSDVHQQGSDLMANHGNPELKPYNTISNVINATWASKWGNFSLYYDYSVNPDIQMPSIIPMQQADGSYLLVTRLENQRNFRDHQLRLNATINAIPDVLTLSSFAIYTHQHSMGNDYDTRFCHWTLGGSLDLELGAWSVNYQFMTQPKDLDGQTITGGENGSTLSVNYTHKNLNLGFGCLLMGYAQGFKYTSDINSRYFRQNSTTQIKDNGNMLFVSLRYRLAHGRKYKTDGRRLENSDNESGVR